jgi:hypothetical protein
MRRWRSLEDCGQQSGRGGEQLLAEPSDHAFPSAVGRMALGFSRSWVSILIAGSTPILENIQLQFLGHSRGSGSGQLEAFAMIQPSFRSLGSCQENRMADGKAAIRASNLSSFPPCFKNAGRIVSEQILLVSFQPTCHQLRSTLRQKYAVWHR